MGQRDADRECDRDASAGNDPSQSNEQTNLATYEATEHDIQDSNRQPECETENPWHIKLCQLQVSCCGCSRYARARAANTETNGNRYAVAAANVEVDQLAKGLHGLAEAAHLKNGPWLSPLV